MSVAFTTVDLVKRCSVEGCQGTHRARGMCATHYRHWQQKQPGRTCQAADCEIAAYARGMCFNHYSKHRRSADFEPLTTEQKFWAQVVKTNSCWNWTGTINSQTGYGYYCNNRVHRLAYEWSKGVIPAGMHIDHTCFNRTCVNPEHLRLVTQKQNNEHQRLRVNNKSGVRGVHKCGRTGKWVAAVGHEGRIIYLGRYRTIEEASAVVVAKRNELFTHNDLDRR